jgi:L-seryl-tRNA(Ser) seleniumtransferase
MASGKEELGRIPGVDKLLVTPEVKKLIDDYDHELVKYTIRKVLQELRDLAISKGAVPHQDLILEKITKEVQLLGDRSLKKVINATGIVVHTNLGRAPFSPEIIKETSKVLAGYNNLEFDLGTGERKTRYFHITELLKLLTGAEDVLVVNNNAAAVMLVLRAFARGREVIVSRGELIEIGGSFRLPDIMAASDCRMVEVGTTNKTKIDDFEQALNNDTAILFKAHKSNYEIRGFTQEASLQELVSLGRKHKIPVVYDMGSGLLRKTTVKILKGEPDVKQTLNLGIDLVTFSGDKLLGAAQAGIIAGRKELVSKLKKEPLLRALRVGKTTLALLESALRYYLDDKILVKHNRIFQMLEKKPGEIHDQAQRFHKGLDKLGIPSVVLDSEGYCGGGALPGEAIQSFAVKLNEKFDSNKQKSLFGERIYRGLMDHETPVVAVLKKGEVFFDMLTIPIEEIEKVINIVNEVYQEVKSR